MCLFRDTFNRIQFVRFSVSSLVSVSQSLFLSLSFSILGSSLILSVMFSLSPLGNLTHFRDKIFKNEVYFVTEDKFIKAHGLILAARSDKIAKILENSENIPAVEFSDDLAGLDTCLNLIYGGRVRISPDNCKTIYKFGELFEINEIIKGVVLWIEKTVAYTHFWQVYFQFNLKVDTSTFVNAIERYLSGVCLGASFWKCTHVFLEDATKAAAVVELLSKINSEMALFAIEKVTNIAITIGKNLPSKSSSDSKKSHQTIISSIVVWINSYVKSETFKENDKCPCIKALKRLSVPCSDVETLKSITALIADIGTNDFPSPAISKPPARYIPPARYNPPVRYSLPSFASSGSSDDWTSNGWS